MSTYNFQNIFFNSEEFDKYFVLSQNTTNVEYYFYCVSNLYLRKMLYLFSFKGLCEIYRSIWILNLVLISQLWYILLSTNSHTK